MDLKKKLSLIIYYAIARHFPTQPVPGYKIGYVFRRFLLKFIVENCGSNIDVQQNCYFGTALGLKIGDRAYLGHNARIGQFVSIGADVLMGPDVVIMTSSHAFEDVGISVRDQGATELRPVVIGRDVWLGTRVIVLPGVTIGEGSVIGAGSVVTKDIPPFSVAVGVPAKVIRKRGSLGVKK